VPHGRRQARYDSRCVRPDLADRFRVFIEAGVLDRVPTRWQLLQGEIEMTPYVISTDATTEEGYRDRVSSKPLLRQLVIFAHVGRDHLRTGSALGARLESICAHLILTFHRGMPVFDLQVIQTHPSGLQRLRAAITETLAASTPVGERRLRIAKHLFEDAPGYLARFLGHEGWIARAERFDYPAPSSEGSKFPPEFFSLVALADYCAATFPASPHDVPATRLPRHVVGLASRRFREGGGMGWLSRKRSDG
jgi:hypothetical protein